MTAVLRVDLDVLAANVARVRATVAPAELMLVVKDDAYGHGLDRIVERARREGVRWFGSFDVETALRVRGAAGDGVRVFAWNAVTGVDIAAAISADIDLGVGEAGLFDEVVAAATEHGAKARVHLKIDTGLRRNGIRPEQWPDFVARAAAAEAAGLVRVEGIWSHIAEASDEEDDAARSRFDAAVGRAREAGLHPSLLHLAASAASFARPEFRYDLVRVGAFCYGIAPAGGPYEDALGIRPAARLEAAVVAVNADTVTVAIGGLDGLPSSLGGRVVVGTPAGPRRLLRLDAHESLVAAWDGAAVGDAVTLYGPGDAGEGSATALGEAIGTIGEEIALRVSPLVPREHVG